MCNIYMHIHKWMCNIYIYIYTYSPLCLLHFTFKIWSKIRNELQRKQKWKVSVKS